MSPVPDNIFSMIIYHHLPFWPGALIIATPICACVTLVVHNGQKIRQITRCFILSQSVVLHSSPSLVYVKLIRFWMAHMNCSPPGPSIIGYFRQEYTGKALSFWGFYYWGIDHMSPCTGRSGFLLEPMGSLILVDIFFLGMQKYILGINSPPNVENDSNIENKALKIYPWGYMILNDIWLVKYLISCLTPLASTY